MVERFNGRVQREVLGIIIYSHSDLETLLCGFNVAYNGRRQRVPKGLSPEMVLRQSLETKATVVYTRYRPLHPTVLAKVMHVAVDVNEVSQPDS